MTREQKIDSLVCWFDEICVVNHKMIKDRLVQVFEYRINDLDDEELGYLYSDHII